MKKIIATLLLLNTISVLKAQNLETKIPNDVDIVISANAENLLDLISITDIDNSALGKEILKDINRSRDQKITSINDAGFNVKSNSYYFFKNTDSIGFHSMTIELKNKKRFESFLKERDLKKIKTENGYSYIEGYKSIRVWNDTFFLLVRGDVSKGYFKKNKERFEKVINETGESSYNFKKNLAQKWVKNYALNIFKDKSSSVIATSKRFQAAKKRNSASTLWVRDYGSLMSGVLNSYSRSLYSSMSYLVPAKDKSIYGVEEVSANLFFEKDNANLVVDMTVDSEMKKSFRKMYNKRMNSALIKSFDHTKALAFFSVSMNTEEILLQYPELMNKMYGGILPEMKEEIDLVGSFFSLLIDEEAIANLVTGDAIFVLNDFAKQEVEYTSYEYDEDYKRKEVIKTKEEMMPDFTIMVGSKEKELLNKVFKLGVKHKVLQTNANVFEFVKTTTKLPFNMYAVVKNNVLYFTTSKNRATSIVMNTAEYSSSNHAKLIKKNAAVAYIDVHKIMDKLPQEMVGRKEKKAFDFGYNNLQDGYFKVSKMRGNKITTEVRLNTTGNEENSLKLFFEFIKSIAK